MLKVANVSYRYPGASHDALTGVSLSVGPGEFHAVLGPNGSGKTTLVRIALGGLTPLVGRADVIGIPASQWSRQELARTLGTLARSYRALQSDDSRHSDAEPLLAEAAAIFRELGVRD